MLGMYLLVALLSQLSLNEASVAERILFPVHGDIQQLNVEFDRLNGVHVGAPVFSEGEVVGNVANILVNTADSSRSAQPKYSVQVEIHAEHRGRIRPGVVALISCPLSAHRGSADVGVELLVLPGERGRDISNSDGRAARTLSVVGYSSFEQFWADTKKPLRS